MFDTQMHVKTGEVEELFTERNEEILAARKRNPLRWSTDLTRKHELSVVKTTYQP